MQGSFGVHSGQGSYEVVLRFNARVADYIREKKWHETQELRDLKQGAWSCGCGCRAWRRSSAGFLNWAGNAVVVKPPELARSVVESARRILAQAENPPKAERSYGIGFA